MRIQDYINTTCINIVRDKKKKFLILIFTICTILTLIILSFRSMFLTYINNSITKNIGFRSLTVTPDFDKKNYGLDELWTIEHVVDIYSSQLLFVSLESSFANDNFDGYITFLYGGKHSLPLNVIGSSFSESDQGVAICPINFYPSNSIYKLKMDDSKILNGHNLLNTSFEVKYYSYEFDGLIFKEKDMFTKSFKIVGVYNNAETMTLNNDCFISPTDIKEIMRVTKFGEVISEDSEEIISAPDFMVIVDSLDNVDYVYSEIEKRGFYGASLQNQVDSALLNVIIISCNITVFLILITVIVLNAFYSKKKVQNESNIIGILMANGYKKNTVKKIYLLELLFTNIFAYLLGFSIFMVIYAVLTNRILKFLYYMGIMLHLHFLDFIFSFLIIVIMSMILSAYYISKKVNLGIIELVRGEE